jgi:hypothetical protein
MFIGEQTKKLSWPIIFITDKLIPYWPEDKQYLYSESDNYSDVWINALEKLNVEQFMYLQEDFILYDRVKEHKLNEYSMFLKNSDYSFVRLIKSGEINQQITDTLYEISSDNDYIFAMQATIWKTKDYINILKNVHESKWLETHRYKDFMKANNIKGLCHFDNEPKRGGNHHDSNVYPYIATALVKGKWITSEYAEELTRLTNQYHIDINNRGTI